MADQAELKPCPFCGGLANFIEAEDVYGRFAAIGCPKCGSGSRQHYFLGDDARDQVAAAWNTRVTEPGAAALAAEYQLGRNDGWDAREEKARLTALKDPLQGKYGDVLAPFVAMMERELHANAGKGDRPGWLQMTPAVGMLEIYYHASKLQKAVKDGNADGIREYGADVANMAMMLVDVCGALFDQREEVEPTVRNDRIVTDADLTHAAIQRAAGELPDGYEIQIGIEKDAGWVDLIGPEGEVEYPTNRESIADQINDAVDAALSAKSGEAS